MSLNFCFIGAGNLATHLAKALYNKGFRILQIYSRTVESAKMLSEKVEADYTADPVDLTEDADVYIIAVKDSAIDEILPKISFSNKLLVHCSGSLTLNVLGKYSINTGVIYPLQTFSKNRDISWKNIPVFVDANNPKNEEKLLGIARCISDSVTVLNSERRAKLHLAAVFACNFVNHFYHIASEILNKEGISFDVLKPLIIETALKVQEMDPSEAQTGPAVRFDESVINYQLKLLETELNYRTLYELVSKSIFENHKQ